MQLKQDHWQAGNFGQCLRDYLHAARGLNLPQVKTLCITLYPETVVLGVTFMNSSTWRASGAPPLIIRPSALPYAVT